MSNKWFIERAVCPVCASNLYKIIFDNPFCENPIQDYLQDFYSSQGIVEFEYLSGANYTLCECKECDLIFQKEIPNDILMKRIYEIWIDPQKAINELNKELALTYYSKYAQEIMQIIAFLDKAPSTGCNPDLWKS